VWLYAANTIGFALVALRMVSLAEHHPSEERKIEDRIGLGMLMLSGVAAILISFVEPKWRWPGLRSICSMNRCGGCCEGADVWRVREVGFDASQY
jgi:hypothetical protein